MYNVSLFENVLNPIDYKCIVFFHMNEIIHCIENSDPVYAYNSQKMLKKKQFYSFVLNQCWNI